jgi:hypothetical protein
MTHLGLHALCSKRDGCIALVCQILGHLASLAEFRHGDNAQIQADVLKRLVVLLEIGSEALACPEGTDSVHKYVCETITIICRDQKDAKKVLLEHGGILPIVKLLQSLDAKVQRAASSVLRTLAFKEDHAKHVIIESGAIQPLIRMLRSEVCPCLQVRSVPIGRSGLIQCVDLRTQQFLPLGFFDISH